MHWPGVLLPVPYFCASAGFPFFNIYFLNLILCVCVFCLHVCLYMHAWYLRKPEEGVPGTGVIDDGEPPCGC